jgi:hypothetical protein
VYARRLLPLLTTAFFLLSAAVFSRAQQAPYTGQVRIARGQDVTPAFEGWMPNADGTFSMYFGYMNRNYDEQLDIPIGPDNNVSFSGVGGGAKDGDNVVDKGGDKGQPTHFYLRRQRMVFAVVIPKDWGLERKVVWTLTTHGKTNVAKGWLQPEWQINKEVIMQEVGGGADLENQPPVFVSGSGPQTVTLPNTVTLTATAQDDGRPKPRVVRDIEDVDVPAPVGLSVRWIQYRGPGGASLERGGAASGYQKPVTATTTVSFKVPGVYVLRAIANDGALITFHDVTVTVK